MLNRLKDVFRSFHEHDVRYLVIGGIASVLYGVPRATFDLGILVEATEGNVDRLLKSLPDANFGTAGLTNAQDVLSNEITIFQDRVRIDVQTSTPVIAFADAWGRRNTVDYDGQDIHVVSKDNLIASKRAAGRDVDLEDVRLLEMEPRDSGTSGVQRRIQRRSRSKTRRREPPPPTRAARSAS